MSIKSIGLIFNMSNPENTLSSFNLYKSKVLLNDVCFKEKLAATKILKLIRIIIFKAEFNLVKHDENFIYTFSYFIFLG